MSILRVEYKGSDIVELVMAEQIASTEVLFQYAENKDHLNGARITIEKNNGKLIDIRVQRKVYQVEKQDYIFGEIKKRFVNLIQDTIKKLGKEECVILNEELLQQEYSNIIDEVLNSALV